MSKNKEYLLKKHIINANYQCWSTFKKTLLILFLEVWKNRTRAWQETRTEFISENENSVQRTWKHFGIFKNLQSFTLEIISIYLDQRADVSKNEDKLVNVKIKCCTSETELIVSFYAKFYLWAVSTPNSNNWNIIFV